MFTVLVASQVILAIQVQASKSQSCIAFLRLIIRNKSTGYIVNTHHEQVVRECYALLRIPDHIQGVMLIWQAR
jgi:hypothetical protein